MMGIMKKVKTLKTAAEVVEAFGGTKAAAAWAGIGESAISNWLARERIPAGWHFRIAEHFGDNTVVARCVFERSDEPRRSRRRSSCQPAA
jgi:hypothetical protein